MIFGTEERIQTASCKAMKRFVRWLHRVLWNSVHSYPKYYCIHIDITIVCTCITNWMNVLRFVQYYCIPQIRLSSPSAIRINAFVLTNSRMSFWLGREFHVFIPDEYSAQHIHWALNAFHIKSIRCSCIKRKKDKDEIIVNLLDQKQFIFLHHCYTTHNNRKHERVQTKAAQRHTSKIKFFPQSHRWIIKLGCICFSWCVGSWIYDVVGFEFMLNGRYDFRTETMRTNTFIFIEREDEIMITLLAAGF